MNNDSKKILCVFLFIAIYTIFFCKNDIIEEYGHGAHETGATCISDPACSADDGVYNVTLSGGVQYCCDNMDEKPSWVDDMSLCACLSEDVGHPPSADSTGGPESTGVECPNNFLCITIDDIHINIDKDKINIQGVVEDAEKVRLQTEVPGLNFDTSRVISYNNAVISLRGGESRDQYSIRIDNMLRYDSRDSSDFWDAVSHIYSSSPPEGLFTETTTTPYVHTEVIQQQNDSMVLYIGAGAFVILVVIVVVYYGIKKRNDIRRVGRMVKKNIEDNKNY